MRNLYSEASKGEVAFVVCLTDNPSIPHQKDFLESVDSLTQQAVVLFHEVMINSSERRSLASILKEVNEHFKKKVGYLFLHHSNPDSLIVEKEDISPFLSGGIVFSGAPCPVKIAQKTAAAAKSVVLFCPDLFSFVFVANLSSSTLWMSSFHFSPHMELLSQKISHLTKPSLLKSREGNLILLTQLAVKGHPVAKGIIDRILKQERNQSLPTATAIASRKRSAPAAATASTPEAATSSSSSSGKAEKRSAPAAATASTPSVEPEEEDTDQELLATKPSAPSGGSEKVAGRKRKG